MIMNLDLLGKDDCNYLNLHKALIVSFIIILLSVLQLLRNTNSLISKSSSQSMKFEEILCFLYTKKSEEKQFVFPKIAKCELDFTSFRGWFLTATIFRL